MMKTPEVVPEEFLHFIWENRLFDAGSLITTIGEPVDVINTGWINTNSGPDFFNAKVKIGSTMWAGNVEVHKKASDWMKHHHSGDRAYENVILHVVEVADFQVRRENGTGIATIELKWPAQITQNFRKLLRANSWISCKNMFHRVDPVILRLGFNRLMVERLEEKTSEIGIRLKLNQNNWSETFYQWMARAFGFKVNREPFDLLAKAVSLHTLLKHKDQAIQVESLLFGVSGMLGEALFGDIYFFRLIEEFRFLQKKYRLKSMEPHLWKFMRMHPGNFPTLRISQLASLVCRIPEIFARLIQAPELDEVRSLLQVTASVYWNNHYLFNKPVPRSFAKSMGEESVRVLIINVIVPFLFVYGEIQNLGHLKNKSLEYLENLPPEDNVIVRRWAELGIEARSSFETQALLQLKNRHCNEKKCLRCPIGTRLVRSI